MLGKPQQPAANKCFAIVFTSAATITSRENIALRNIVNKQITSSLSFRSGPGNQFM